MPVNLESVVKILHQINFDKNNGILHMGNFNDDYRYSEFFLDYNEKKILVHKNKCTGNCNICKDNFSSVTHGTHTFDFLDAHGINRSEIEGWSKYPVVFVFENPSNINDDYFYINTSPAYPKRWYWISYQSDTDNNKFIYPNFFVNKEYGWMVYSAIRTFKIANAYVTNMVKCGKCNDKKGYLTTDEYDASDINNCIEKILVKEIDAVRGEDPEQSVILFAFGDRVYDKLKDKKNCFGKCNIYKLPHPASRLQNSYRKYVLFGQIYSALLENNFYEKNADMPNITELLVSKPACSDDDTVNLDSIVEKWTNERKNVHYQKRTTYKDDCIAWQITSTYDDYCSIIFKLRKNCKINGADYKVTWIEFNIKENSLSFYDGTDNTANTPYSRKYIVDQTIYKEMKELIDSKIMQDYLIRQYGARKKPSEID